MPQLGKYSSDRDNILHFLCISDWANESFGDVESPTGYVWRISNNPADVHMQNTEITSLIEDQLQAYDIEDSPEFRKTLEGHFLVREHSNGSVSVIQYPVEEYMLAQYQAAEREYDEWAGDGED